MSLRCIIKNAPGSLESNTVMSAATDPYRIDTPGNHASAEWLASAWRQTDIEQIHCRGLHYALVSLRELLKPNGERYKNTEDDWVWLQKITNYARWLGHIEFESILDERNSGPELWLPPSSDSEGIQVSHNAHWLDDAPEMPRVKIECLAPHARQAYKLVLIGEKSSLRHVLQPICQRYEAELILPTGELSTTLLYGIVSRAAADGRPCRVFYLSDFDPSGTHMPVEVARKIQALCDLRFPGLDIEVHRCALLPDQVKDLGLPETPLKDSEKRADRWRERYGCEQTEIDALSTLKPKVLTEIVESDLKPYFDQTLQKRQRQAYEDAAKRMRDQIDAAMQPFDAELLEAQDRIDEAASQLALAHEFALPLFDEIARSITPAEPELTRPEYCPDFFPRPLFSSLDAFEVTTKNLLLEKL
jgi:hypothetical protein